MKFKLLASSVLMAGALMGSGTASATLVAEWEWTGTLQNWADANYNGNGAGAIIDISPPNPANSSANPVGTVVLPGGDGDTTFTFNSTNFSLDTKVTLSEFEDSITGKDYYHVDFDNPIAGVGIVGSVITYSIRTTDPEGLNWARLGETNVGGGASEVIKQIYARNLDGSNGALLLTLDSINGLASPPVGYGDFGTQTSFNVVDTIVVGPVEHLTNEFTVPEPMTLAMMGLGFAAFGYSRRNTLSKGLSA